MRHSRKKTYWKNIANKNRIRWEQVLKIGPKINHSKISPPNPLPWLLCASCVAFSIPVKDISFARICGNNKTIPNKIKIPADILVRVFGLTPNWLTRYCSPSVNMIILTANAKIISQGRDFLPSITDHQIITGKIGKTHGASTVRIPAIRERI